MSPIYDDREDDVALHTRGSSSEREGGRRAPEQDRMAPDREVTLNTGVVLGLFFALALLCAVFFGFGYSMGHKSAPAPVAADTEPVPADVASPAGSAAKPSASAPANTPVPGYVPSTGTSSAAAAEKAVVRSPKGIEPATANANGSPAATTPVPASAEKLPPAHPAPIVRTAPQPPAQESASTATPAGGATTTFVQVAAVSHQEDADVLSSALRRRGYAVLSRADAADHLIHVQIGPFSNRKEAEAMRQRLQGDGYNAFLK